jgi:hypothetical protein
MILLILHDCQDYFCSSAFVTTRGPGIGPARPAHYHVWADNSLLIEKMSASCARVSGIRRKHVTRGNNLIADDRSGSGPYAKDDFIL